MTDDAPRAGVIILAAGGSARLGSPKQLLPFRGRSLLFHACETALASKCHSVFVVLGAQSARLRQEVETLPVWVVENENWCDGIGTSIKAGIGALAADKKLSAAILMLCDQPLLAAHHLDELVQVHSASGKPIVASLYADTLGVPALFDRIFFDELLHLPPNAGAKALIKRHPDKVCGLPFADGALDIDTPLDFERLKIY